MSVTAPGFPSASREFALLAACCRWPADAAAVRAAAVEAIDWQRFTALIRRHRVLGLAQRALDRAGVAVPPAVADRWALAVKRVAERNLRLLAESARLADLLAGAGVAAAFVKGATLAELAYGDQAFKQSTDIDLVVPVADVRTTIAVLHGAGYGLKAPKVDLDASRLAILTDTLKEAAFVCDRTMVDLHWRLASIPGLIADVDPARDIATVGIDGRALPTLIGQRLLDYLAVHGGRHGWARLKWLADFNALLTAMSEEEIAAFHREAAASGSGVCAGVALLQAHRLLGARLPADLLATILRSRRVRWLAAMSDGLMIGPDELAGQDERPARYWLDTIAGSFLMSGRPRYLAACVWHAWVAPDDALALPLPRPLWPLYAVISPVARTGRGVAKIGRALAAKTGWSRAADRPMGARQ